MTDDLRRLQEENRRLRRENEYLRHRAEQLGDRSVSNEDSEDAFQHAARNFAALRSRGYLDYLIFLMKTSRSFRLFDKTTFAVRNVFFFSKMWRILTTVFAAVGLSAQAVLTVGFLAVLLPAAALVSAALAIVGFFSYRRWNRILGDTLEDGKIYLLFEPPKGKRDRYFSNMVDSFSKDGTVLIVSRSFADCGWSGFKFLGEGKYRIYISYYFSLSGRLDRMKSDRIVRIV